MHYPKLRKAGMHFLCQLPNLVNPTKFGSSLFATNRSALDVMLTDANNLIPSMIPIAQMKIRIY